MIFYKKVFHIVFIVMASICWSDAFAQEELRPLSGNINLPAISAKPHLAHKTTTITPLTLPFFDDFSYAYKSVYPSESKWLDSNVYVNTGFAIAPLSIGVATFDGLNKKGYPYDLNASVSNSGPADVLTSKPIDLQTNIVDDSLYLSFYYQAEGNGDSPEANDSLAVDFFKSKQNKWVKVWGVKGYNPSATDTNFHRVFIPIKDTAYFNDAFQFRFRNRATLSGSLDHWHLDYVRLKENGSLFDTSHQDMAFVYRSTSFLKNYWAMPYKQYDPLEMAISLNNFMRNNFTSASIVEYDYEVFNSSNASVSQYDGQTTNMDPFQPTHGYHDVALQATPVFTYVPPAPLSGPTYFTIKHNIHGSASDEVPQNDTLVQVQKFADYYAYDDGTAEVGYYLNAYGARAALKFKLNVVDTLRAVNIYFDPIVQGGLIQSSSFRIMVWNDGGNGPGSLLYKDSLVAPVYVQGCHNLMPTYKLTSCLPLNATTYYIGVQQTTNQPLNIGFDKNTNHGDALYYDISGNWAQSVKKGSIMINPVMGCAIVTPTTDCAALVGVTEHIQNKFDHLTLFPNPAQNTLTIKSTVGDQENTSIEIRSTLGQTVFESRFENNQTIDISHLPNGIYFVSLNNKEQNVTPKKLIISR